MARGYPDHEGDKSGLYEKPEWAAFEGKDKNFYDVANNKASGLSVSESYVVPAGKTLYITSFSFICIAAAVADRDLNQMCYGWIHDGDLASTIWSQGGNGGGFATFSKPLVFAAGNTVSFACTNYANHNCNLAVSANGYEV